MTDEAAELAEYLPISFKTNAEQEYVKFFWDAFETNYVHGKYQFAFLAYHMLTMCFVYFSVWQIKQSASSDFGKSLIGFSKEHEKSLLAASSPFAFSIVNESVVLRFLKLIDCDNSKIGTYAKLVQERNDSAHSNGNIFFEEQSSLDAKIRDVLRIVREIQSHSRTLIGNCYNSYLQGSSDPEAREYEQAADQNREILVHGNYMSQKDIEICLDQNLEKYRYHPGFAAIEALHKNLAEQFADD